MNGGQILLLLSGFALLTLGANGIGLAIFTPDGISERRKIAFATEVVMSVVAIIMIFWAIL